jgi:hypothetical protein
VVRWSFLGVPVCMRAWRQLSQVNPWRVVKDARKGAEAYQHAGFRRPSVIEDQMHGAIWVAIRHFANSSPLAPGTDGHKRDPEEILMPFHEKVYLFRVLQLWHAQRATESAESAGSIRQGPPALFSRPPKYRTFLKVLGRPEFAKVKFHRVVSMARCPKCCFLRWKCMSVPLEERGHWQQLAAAHQCLQLAQKRTYAADRAVAASDFPQSEVYMAMDGGSGAEFVLPHLAPHDTELPSKAVATFHTLPMKVLNGLVHGDHRSHVVLSPGSVVAGASHTCEGVAIILNTVFQEHGKLPRRISLQLDNAATNHNMLVLAFMGLYVAPGQVDSTTRRVLASFWCQAANHHVCQVLHGVVTEARVRFELENHAHDLYDAYHATLAQL